MSRDDLTTLIICLACGGNYKITEELDGGRYRMRHCRWCTHGGMTREQQVAWTAFSQKRKQSSGEMKAVTKPTHHDD